MDTSTGDDKMEIILWYFEIVRYTMIALALLTFSALWMVGRQIYRQRVPEQTPNGVGVGGKGTP